MKTVTPLVALLLLSTAAAASARADLTRSEQSARGVLDLIASEGGRRIFDDLLRNGTVATGAAAESTSFPGVAVRGARNSNAAPAAEATPQLDATDGAAARDMDLAPRQSLAAELDAPVTSPTRQRRALDDPSIDPARIALIERAARSCFARLGVGTTLRVDVTVRYDADGRLTDVAAQSEDSGSQRVASCVAAATRAALGGSHGAIDSEIQWAMNFVALGSLP